MNNQTILIGRGQLNWNRYERQSDRYGAVHLTVKDTEAAAETFIATGIGTLEAIVLEPIPSEHMGDLARGICQTKVPDTGDKFTLGEGEFFSEVIDGLTNVGVKPADGRKHDWMNPENLYQCHNSVVELHWIPS